ncbi:DUF342 domain-containing protein [Treponema phagedenis]|uniref:DUF342 domain-containing protein n=1 Tax=Treponema phagedenis TaxID=162 RepID=A0A0B7GQR1_TREPH|nr:FapA family protein [Treponema phagedenis]NVP24632.1 DUF342 domain-containing protein [Treponema phagedenis]QEJ97616.1 DUF342 domain-containing protein [Treponema phagedenis]QEK03185.1 DUF342 domain-containing protein [Treponema phagedenis]QEK08810.1 DUF342 domain-containing protein [Treponema phagedenis]QKS91907.1 DUF342 domain-containing protein [Treponema phagedenis]
MSEKIWHIQKNQKSNRWYLSFDSIPDGDFPHPKDILQEAEKTGLSPLQLIREESIQKYFDKIQETGNLEPLEIELNPKFDARIIVSQDKLQAELYVRKARENPNSLNTALIMNILNSSGIKSINTAAIQKELESFVASEKMEFFYVIAEGEPPTRGKNRELISHLPAEPHKNLQAVIARLKNPDAYTDQKDNPVTDSEFPLSEADALYLVSSEEVLYDFSEPTEGTSGLDIYGEVIESLPGNDPFVSDLRNITQNSDSLIADKTGVLLHANTEGGVKLRIIPYKNASARAAVSRDQTEVSLFLEEGKGAGIKLSKEIIMNALQKINITENIPDESIHEAITHAQKAEKETEYIILTGEHAVLPNSYEFSWIADLSASHAVTVEKNSVILKARFMPEGKAGKTVFGENILPEKGVSEKLPDCDQSISVQTEGTDKIYTANISGELTRVNNCLSISVLKTINTAIDEIANEIYFPGNLLITGNIPNEKTIKVAGSIQVKGNVGIDFLSAQNALVIEGGIQGKKRGILWAKNTIEIKFAESARLYAGKRIHIQDHCFGCIVKTNDMLILTGNPGVLIGGNIHAARGIEAKEIGAKKRIQTLISFGQDYLIKDEIEVHEKEMRENNARLAILESSIEAKKEAETLQQALTDEKVKLLKRNKELGLRIFKLKENFETHIESEIRVLGTVYPGTVFESHGRFFEVTEELMHVIFYFDKECGLIQYKDIIDEV